ncbi:MAG: hypothetical protein ACI9XU_000710 [Arenicella sp.]|jgi:hypothetical protein
MTDNLNSDHTTLDWRVVFGITVTSIWLLLGAAYLTQQVGLTDFVDLPTGEIGSFLEGAFAPLAFLWLVIGHFMQQAEISANTKAVQLQEQSAKRQELHSRRNGYFKLLTLVQEQLGAIAGFHYISVCGETGTGEIGRDDYTAMRNDAGSGDPALFVREMVSLAVRNVDDSDAIKEIFFGTDIRTRHSNNFEQTFGKLLKSARAVDQDDMVVNALLYGSAWGMLYRVIRAAQGKEKIDPVTGFATEQGAGRN